MEETTKTLATKDDFANRCSEIVNEFEILRKEMGGEFASLRKNMRIGFASIRKEIIEAKVDTIEWMFIFWISQIAATLSIVFLFLKK